MKRRLSQKVHRTYTSRLIVVGVLIVASIYSVVFARWYEAANAQQTIVEARLARYKPSLPPVTVKIGDVPAFRALVGDYTSPSSLWVLANKQHPLTDPNYKPGSLVHMPVLVRPDLSEEESSVSSVIAQPLTQMFSAASSQGYHMIVGSAFRSGTLQQFYFDTYVRTQGEAAARQFSALPGQSEHQTGLAVDISTDTKDCYLSECFIEAPEGAWLAAHAHEFGFILRYPKDKTAITGYNYEPWHYRYVGKPLAGALYASGLTFEEVQPQLHRASDQLKARGLIK